MWATRQTFAFGSDLSLPTYMFAAVDNGNTVSEETQIGNVVNVPMFPQPDTREFKVLPERRNCVRSRSEEFVG